MEVIMLHHRPASVLALIAGFVLIANAQSYQASHDFYNRGRQRYFKGDIDGAIADFTKAIETSSHPAGDRGNHKDLKARLDFTGTASSFDRVTLIDPVTALAYVNRAVARCHKGDLDGAVSDCESAIAIDPGLIEAYYNRGLIYWSRKDYDQALGDFDRVIKSRPQDSQ